MTITNFDKYSFIYHFLFCYSVLVMPTLRQCAEDKSWRVRYMVADKFTELQVRKKLKNLYIKICG